MGSATRQISEKKPGALTMKFLHQHPKTSPSPSKTGMLAATQSSMLGMQEYTLKKQESIQEHLHKRRVLPPENCIPADANSNVPITAEGANL